MSSSTSGKNVLTTCLSFLLLLGTAQSLAAAEPPAPQSIYAVRVGPGVIGVEWTVKSDTGISGFRLLRSEKRDGPYTPIADRSPDQPFYLDTDIKPSRVYFYKVSSLGKGQVESAQTGPECAWDDDQMLANGGFELDPLGEMAGQPLDWPRRAYNAATPVVIVEGGPEGKQCVEVRASNVSVSGGFHSGFIPAVEGEVFDQFAWAKALPGAKPMVGRCFHTENREGVKVGKKPYDYTNVGKPRPDGWQPHEGSFTVPETGAYCKIWIIGFKARNTLWFDGVRLMDRTSRQVRAFPYEARRAEARKMVESSRTAQAHRGEFEQLEKEMATIRQRMVDELQTLSPLEYRRLLVALDRAQQQYADLIWKVKTLGLLLD